jgi:hypothetical protein
MGFRVEVKPDTTWVGDEKITQYHITIWQGNHGNTLSPPFRSKKKANRVARALFKILLPEYRAERARLHTNFLHFRKGK